MRVARTIAPALFAFASISAAFLIAPAADGSREQDAPQGASPQLLKAEQARELLGAVIGVWDMQGQSIGADGKPEFTLRGRCVWQWAMNGAFLMGDTMLSNGSAVLQEIDCIGFNAAAGTFQRTLMTDRDSAMIWQQGTWDASSRKFTMQSVGAIPTASGTKRQIATVVDLSQQGQIAWTTSYFEAGQLVGTIRISGTRAAAGSVPAGGIPGMPMQPPSLASGGGLDPQGLQDQLNQMVAHKQQLQGQIEAWKQRVRGYQQSFDQLSQP
ncbi:MAG: DUF1579 family protein [Planctomycetota bacterium]